MCVGGFLQPVHHAAQSLSPVRVFCLDAWRGPPIEQAIHAGDSQLCVLRRSHLVSSTSGRYNRPLEVP